MATLLLLLVIHELQPLNDHGLPSLRTVKQTLSPFTTCWQGIRASGLGQLYAKKFAG
jgi:hypothetical protein